MRNTTKMLKTLHARKWLKRHLIKMFLHDRKISGDDFQIHFQTQQAKFTRFRVSAVSLVLPQNAFVIRKKTKRFYLHTV